MGIRKAAAADKQVVTEILTRSFADNLSVGYIAGWGSDRKARVQALMGYAFEVCLRFGQVLVSDDLRGCALVLYPDHKRFSLWSLRLDLELILNCVGFGRLLKVLRRESLVGRAQPPGLKAYLWFIGVDPDFQGQGIGAALMRQVIDQGALDGRSLVLETSAMRNVPWYESFGFLQYHELDLGYKLLFFKRS